MLRLQLPTVTSESVSPATRVDRELRTCGLIRTAASGAAATVTKPVRAMSKKFTTPKSPVARQMVDPSGASATADATSRPGVSVTLQGAAGACSGIDTPGPGESAAHTRATDTRRTVVVILQAPLPDTPAIQRSPAGRRRAPRSRPDTPEAAACRPPATSPPPPSADSPRAARQAGSCPDPVD